MGNLGLNQNPIKFDENFRNYRVHEDARIEVSNESESELFWQLVEMVKKFKETNPNDWKPKLLDQIEKLKEYVMQKVA